MWWAVEEEKSLVGFMYFFKKSLAVLWDVMRGKEKVRGNLLLATTYRKRRGEGRKNPFCGNLHAGHEELCKTNFHQTFDKCHIRFEVLLQIGKFCTCTCFPRLKHLASAAVELNFSSFSSCDKRCCDIFIYFRNILHRRISRSDGKTLSLESNGNGNWRGGGGYRFEAAAAPPPFFRPPPAIVNIQGDNMKLIHQKNTA